MTFQEPFRVAILEDDPYAANFMSMIIRRDWRTRLVCKHTSLENFAQEMEICTPQILLVDLEHPFQKNWIKFFRKQIATLSKKPKVIALVTNIETISGDWIFSVPYTGLLFKQEINWALAWAIVIANQGNWVATPSVKRLVENTQNAPKHLRFLKGDIEIPRMTVHEIEMARIAILFNLSRRDMADELILSPYTVQDYVGLTYEKLGLQEMFLGELAPQEIFNDSPVILEHISKAIRNNKTGKVSITDKETIAFHLLTKPQEIY